MITHDDIITDHKILTATYNSKQQIYHPKFVQTKNKKLFTRENLLKGLLHSEINAAFHHTDPNFIAEIIQVELGSIIESISPLRTKQFKTAYTPFYDIDTLNKIEESQKLLT